LAFGATSVRLLERAFAIAASWGWEHPGALGLLAAAGESGVLEPLVEELTQGVMEPDEAALLLEDLRERLGTVAQRATAASGPGERELEELLEIAWKVALEWRETELQPLHVAHALIRKALSLGREAFGTAERLLLRRLASGPRLAGAPPASRRIASIDL